MRLLSLSPYLLLSLAILVVSYQVRDVLRRIYSKNDGPARESRPSGEARPVVARTGDQWAQELRCKRNASLQDTRAGPASSLELLRKGANLWPKLMDECNREANAWRYKYYDELKPSLSQQVNDASIDERLANVIYTISLNTILDVDYFKFDSGDPAEDASNELRVAGPEVDDARCGRDLASMAELYDDLQARLRRARGAPPDNANATAGDRLGLDGRHIRLARVLDSFGRYESGSLDGRLFLAGSYDECIGSQLVVSDPHARSRQADGVEIQMRYCWARMDTSHRLHPLLKSRERSMYETSQPALKVAVCLPKSCHSKSFRQRSTRAIVQRLVDGQLQLPGSIYLDRRLRLDSVFCLVDGDSEHGRIPASGKLCLLLLGCWTALCVWITLTNRAQRRRRRRPESADSERVDRPPFLARCRSCLDLERSFNELLSGRQSDPAAPVNLDVMNPVKVVLWIMFVFAHTAMAMAPLVSDTLQLVAQFDTQSILMSFLWAHSFVDTFFVMSGALIAYSYLRRYSRLAQSAPTNGETSPEGRPSPSSPQSAARAFIKQWFCMSLARYARLVPVYALMFWFRRDVLDRLGSGPFWDHALNKQTPNGACSRQPWYVPFTFAAAFGQLAKQCFLPAWYISNDILFALVTPPIILLLLRRPRLATIGAIGLAVASQLIGVSVLAGARPASVWELLEAKYQGLTLMFTEMAHVYTWPLFRASSVLVGLLAGYHLFKYERDQLGQTKGALAAASNGTQPDNATGWPRWLTGPATALAVLYVAVHIVVSLCVNHLKHLIEPNHRLLLCFSLTGDRLVWSLANAVILLQMATTWRHSPLMELFASQLWRALAKLVYAFVFVHWMLVVVYTGNMLAAPTLTFWGLYAATSIIGLCALAISGLVYVLLESPIDRLLRSELIGSVERQCAGRQSAASGQVLLQRVTK
jgi:peptidoglycan/LPS O-acetylase OafA/YrhL